MTRSKSLLSALKQVFIIQLFNPILSSKNLKLTIDYINIKAFDKSKNTFLNPKSLLEYQISIVLYVSYYQLTIIAIITVFLFYKIRTIRIIDI